MVRTRMAVRLRLRQKGRLSWAGWTVAPWCLGASLLVSFVADAGQDPNIGATRVFLSARALEMPSTLIAALPDVAAPRSLSLPEGDAIVQQARLFTGEMQDIATTPDEIDPKPTLKTDAKQFPAIDRSHKSDPDIGLRPTFEARLRNNGSLDGFYRAALAFSDSDPGAPPHELLPPTVDVPGPDSVARFEPMPDGAAITTKPSQAGASPGGGVAGATTPHVQDGATPNVARAVVLASATPVEPETTPVQIAPLPKYSRGANGKVATNTTLVMGVIDPTPAYAAMIDPSQSQSEQRCLAEAVYFESRSEPEEGQAAVAQVVLNRVISGLYPKSICGVVFQNQQRHNACQFSFACEGHGLHVNESESWSQAVRVAHEVLDGAAYVSDVGGATHYHANYARPDWARHLVKMDQIGHHIFYKLRPGQT